MSGARPTTESLKDKIRRAADQRNIELDAVTLVEDGDQRRFRIIETDASDETNQVGFEIVEPGGPTGQTMFNRRLQQYMDELRKHVQGEDAETVDDTDTNADDTTTDTTSAESTPTGDTAEDAEPPETRPAADSTSTLGTADVTVAFDDESTAELIDAIKDAIEDARMDTAEFEARLDELDERVARLEDALGGLAQLTTDEDD